MQIFPDNFLWGVSTSSFQIEGSTKEYGRGESIWDRFCNKRGNIADGSSGEHACDHYHRYKEDVKLMKELGVEAYRFSISWSRIQPHGRGNYNSDGIQFYNRLVDELLTQGIEPWLCLNHWDLPQALQDQGGWSNRDTAWRFMEYSWKMGEILRDRIKHVIPHNEPNVLAILGHGVGIHAPGLKNADACFAASHHLNMAYGLAARELKICSSKFNIGLLLSLQPVVEKERDPDAADRLDSLWNRMFLDPVIKGAYPKLLEKEINPWIVQGDIEIIQHQPDFFGLNHYTVMRTVSDNKATLGIKVVGTEVGTPKTDMGWEIRPKALLEQLLELKDHYGNIPVYITENGCACSDFPDDSGVIHDPERIEYINNYLQAGHEALEQGVDLKGWFFWSLLDNFEWNHGYSKRFGLVYVDYNNQQRVPKQSFRYIQKLIEDNTLMDFSG